MKENTLILQAHAKINLGLRILGRRPGDAYHLLETVFQELDFGDEIRIREMKRKGSPQQRFRLRCSDPELPADGSNLILKALALMLPRLPEDLGLDITLRKRIPLGSGLGGGSSDAAAMLKYLNRYAKLPQEELHARALQLGADVPFFLLGGTAYAQGIGDKLRKLEIPKDWYAVLVFPGFGISTPGAYAALRISLTDRVKKAIIPSQLEKGFSWEIFENTFDAAIIPSYPRIGEIRDRLYQKGAVYAALSGSGSTVFGICESCDIAEKASAAFDHALIARPL
ncbi:MAG: 4-(cytidine 5'-diphospho)-2-C-methyl-D-erythritol kinase [Candidatus Neomarinimicrobiota bacterium]|jgi:4-diphosphocytidyl-2-C-methyl-D-erythritol kinase|nr:4-(cytidine 5'-diphospho)-2-C-methyl-D-erythritol kinase [Candidatus Neomarinimicrobiota bacterium]MDD3965928.1 4-(cytidine 5'-diphospho)-2-C-methyl-D-erythritol kinase [Candidatus Neomarinimicrobiota bacterium]MDX9780113.1 4-(cytidine 5'-diphospho)-2-C-methyl-D-erythritol kinase [bacterium]